MITCGVGVPSSALRFVLIMALIAFSKAYGSSVLTVVKESGIDPDIAAVQFRIKTK
jgi:hypothetical protein